MKLIDKDAVVAEIEKRRDYYEGLQMIKSVYFYILQEIYDIRDFINTLEVKEVDLEEEIKEKSMTDKVQKIRQEVARIQLYTQSGVLKQILDYIDNVQKEPVSMWHDASEGLA